MSRKRSSGTEDPPDPNDDGPPYKDLLEWLALLLAIIEMLKHLL